MGIKVEKRPTVFAEGAFDLTGDKIGDRGVLRVDVSSFPVDVNNDVNIVLPSDTFTSYDVLLLEGEWPLNNGNIRAGNLQIDGPHVEKLTNKRFSFINITTSAVRGPFVDIYLNANFNNSAYFSMSMTGPRTAEIEIIAGLGARTAFKNPLTEENGLRGFLNNDTITQPNPFGLRIGSAEERPSRRYTITIDYTHNFSTTPFFALPLFVGQGTSSTNNLIIQHITSILTQNVAVTERAIGTTPITSNAVMTDAMKSLGVYNGSNYANSRDNATLNAHVNGLVLPSNGGVYLNVRGTTGTGRFLGTVNLIGLNSVV